MGLHLPLHTTHTFLPCLPSIYLPLPTRYIVVDLVDYIHLDLQLLPPRFRVLVVGWSLIRSSLFDGCYAVPFAAICHTGCPHLHSSYPFAWIPVCVTDLHTFDSFVAILPFTVTITHYTCHLHTTLIPPHAHTRHYTLFLPDAAHRFVLPHLPRYHYCRSPLPRCLPFTFGYRLRLPTHRSRTRLLISRCSPGYWHVCSSLHSLRCSVPFPVPLVRFAFTTLLLFPVPVTLFLRRYIPITPHPAPLLRCSCYTYVTFYIRSIVRC